MKDLVFSFNIQKSVKEKVRDILASKGKYLFNIDGSLNYNTSNLMLKYYYIIHSINSYSNNEKKKYEKEGYSLHAKFFGECILGIGGSGMKEIIDDLKKYKLIILISENLFISADNKKNKCRNYKIHPSIAGEDIEIYVEDNKYRFINKLINLDKKEAVKKFFNSSKKEEMITTQMSKKVKENMVSDENIKIASERNSLSQFGVEFQLQFINYIKKCSITQRTRIFTLFDECDFSDIYLQRHFIWEKQQHNKETVVLNCKKKLYDFFIMKINNATNYVEEQIIYILNKYLYLKYLKKIKVTIDAAFENEDVTKFLQLISFITLNPEASYINSENTAEQKAVEDTAA